MPHPFVRRTAKPVHALICGILLLIAPAALPAGAATPPAPDTTTWIYPAIADFGAVHPRDDVAVRPDPAVDYKVFVHMVSEDQDKTGMYSALDRVARIVNLMAYAKVPPERVHIVVLLDHKTALAAMTNAYTQKTTHADNPNLKVIHALKAAGVEFQICSQALAGRHIADDEVDPAVTITLSALTDMIVYGQRGYSYMQL